MEHQGDLVPLLELGAGFDKQYTGSENIYLYGAMLGYSKALIDEKYDEIVRFARLRRFMDILILDEVLAVGDARFRRKCIRKLKRMFDKGITVLFVSHSIEQVRKVCNRAVLLENGEIVADGDTDTVIDIYQQKLEIDEEE